MYSGRRGTWPGASKPQLQSGFGIVTEGQEECAELLSLDRSVNEEYQLLFSFGIGCLDGTRHRLIVQFVSIA
jgi:hypothetical protein